jgi:hypothetical protein
MVGHWRWQLSTHEHFVSPWFCTWVSLSFLPHYTHCWILEWNVFITLNGLHIMRHFVNVLMQVIVNQPHSDFHLNLPTFHKLDTMLLVCSQIKTLLHIWRNIEQNVMFAQVICIKKNLGIFVSTRSWLCAWELIFQKLFLGRELMFHHLVWGFTTFYKLWQPIKSMIKLKSFATIGLFPHYFFMYSFSHNCWIY